MDVLEWLIEILEIKDKDHQLLQKALVTAAGKGQLVVVEFLLKYGVSVNAKDSDGTRPYIGQLGTITSR